MRKVAITINDPSDAARAFTILKQFDSRLLLGPTLALIRDRKPACAVEVGGISLVTELEEILNLVDSLESAGLAVTLTVTEFRAVDTDHFLLDRIATRSEIEEAMRGAQALADQRALEERRRQQWLNSPEGQAYVAARELVQRIRVTLEERWKELGYESLNHYEHMYIDIWYLCVEVDTGGFEQYFYNSYSDRAEQALASLEVIGAPNSHRILREAMDCFAAVGGFTSQRETRQLRLDLLPPEALRTPTENFFQLAEDLRSMALGHVGKNYSDDHIELSGEG